MFQTLSGSSAAPDLVDHEQGYGEPVEPVWVLPWEDYDPEADPASLPFTRWVPDTNRTNLQGVQWEYCLEHRRDIAEKEAIAKGLGTMHLHDLAKSLEVHAVTSLTSTEKAMAALEVVLMSHQDLEPVAKLGKLTAMLGKLQLARSNNVNAFNERFSELVGLLVRRRQLEKRVGVQLPPSPSVDAAKALRQRNDRAWADFMVAVDRALKQAEEEVALYLNSTVSACDVGLTGSLARGAELDTDYDRCFQRECVPDGSQKSSACYTSVNVVRPDGSLASERNVITKWFTSSDTNIEVERSFALLAQRKVIFKNDKIKDLKLKMLKK